jgi:hypothetical protein
LIFEALLLVQIARAEYWNDGAKREGPQPEATSPGATLSGLRNALLSVVDADRWLLVAFDFVPHASW